MSEVEQTGSNLKPLLGTDEATVDSKGRILISKKKRDRLGSDFAMCLGENGCLYAYPGPRWEKFIAEIEAYDPGNQARQMYTRLVLTTADDELDFDDQGRVVVPLKLRKMAKLEKEVLILGCLDHLEIWAKEEYEQFEKYPDSYGGERRTNILKAYKEMKGL